MITVALTKGRLFKDFLKYMNENDLNNYIRALDGETRSLYTIVDNVKFIFAKGPDVPTYVESGVADLGIVGSDIITEDTFNILNVSQLPFGDCHFSVAALPDQEEFRVIATKYTNIAHEYFKNKRQDVSLIHLNGSVELAPLLGLSDGIVDIVQTGGTLRDNGLVEHEKIMDIHARLIANKRTFYTKEDEIYDFIKEIGVIE
ncbi:ATP phosphoribosyltransferase [Salinicoccus roseus]|jgi:ATP phosphoribosyltransferase|uniref:ATP phosphoribosyltransferase n=1 Tax=Salinicoccus roseus TaxID=45670 RepID=A0A0C2E506_9STAP|nr:ATP phosphoribosyltransferase [Salinicoccus roseus]KIH70397.1 ATP phosphoribosyltransferase [Salinicoccus roseus]MDB0580944.1 ATP phosphoribosyltransferase [Salinicoccus roseus]OZT77361.1 ATP phosphoribosyltransferase [Salinicoccus roseus]RPE53015.1 ATP phosphoribosyltransferase [Salinicoccus roseus]GGA71540.1 ATP phosphoribosyltransferase [Salinicoccus roseus]